MKQSSFRHYKLTQSDRHTIPVERFRGVDYSTQKFLVANGRAIDLKNYIYKDGVVQKRNGIEELFEVKDFTYFPADFSNPSRTNSQEAHDNKSSKNFNGIWCFTGEDNQEHIVAHIGKLMYEIKNIRNRDLITCEPIVTGTATVNGETHYVAYEFEDFKSSAYVGGHKLWFQGGNKYMLLRFIGEGTMIFVQVENSEYTPIPTTTISITYANAVTSDRMPLDKVNLLTKWRKNKLISGATKSETDLTKTQHYEYTLDAPLICENTSDMAGVSIQIEERGVIDDGKLR